MPDIEENKTVDIDTSGPGAEVELEDNSKEENTSPEVKHPLKILQQKLKLKKNRKKNRKKKN